MTVVYSTKDDEDECDVAPYAVFAEVLVYTDEPDQETYGLQTVVNRLRDETNAVEAWASGFTEGTFFYDSKAAALTGAKVIQKHANDYVARSTYRFKNVDFTDVLNGFRLGDEYHMNPFNKVSPALARLTKLGIVEHNPSAGVRNGRTYASVKLTPFGKMKLKMHRDRERERLEAFA